MACNDSMCRCYERVKYDHKAFTCNIRPKHNSPPIIMKQQVTVLSNIDAVAWTSKLRHIINENSTVVDSKA